MTLTQIKPAGLSKPVDLADNEKIRLGTGTDSEIFSDGTHTKITQLNNAGYIGLNANNFRILSGDGSESIIKAFKDGAVELYYDNDRKLRTVSNGAFIETTSGDCYLTVRTESDNSSDDAVVRAYTQNNQASGYLMFGDIDDTFMGGLRYNNSSDTLFFYTNNVATWRIDSNGNLFTNDDSRKLQLGAAEDLQLWHDGTHSHIQNTQNSGKLKIRSHETNIKNSDDNETQAVFHENGAVELYYDNAKKFETMSTGAYVEGYLAFPDNGGLKIGSGNDLQIYHNGNHSRILDNGTGKLQLGSDTEVEILNGSFNETMTKFQPNGPVELYYDNSKKFETTSYGTFTSGTHALSGNLDIANDTGKIKLGTSADLEIYHDGNQSIIRDTGTGSLMLQGSQVIMESADGGEVLAKFIDDGAVELYWNNSKRFWTTDHGGYLMDNDDSVELRLLTSGETPRGYLYANSNNEVGILDEGGNWAIRHHNDTITEFRIANGVKASITTHGGIAFGTDTAAANTLDDYEEGTWSPDPDDGNNVFSHGQEQGRYIKIGHVVHCTFSINVSLSGTSGFAMFMTGLPFTVKEFNENTNEGISTSKGTGQQAQLEAQQGQTKFKYRNPTSGAAMSVNDVGCVNSVTKALRGAITYITT